MNIKLLDLARKEEWMTCLQRLPVGQQDIYYTPEYYSLYEKNGDGEAYCFVFEQDGEIALYPFLMNCVNDAGYKLSRKFYDIQGAYGYNGVVSSCNSQSFIDSFHDSFDEYCREKGIIAEFTRFNPYLGNHTFSGNSMDISINRKTVCLEIDRPYEKIWSESYDTKNRNMIRKAHKARFEIVVQNSEEAVRRSYQIYLARMMAIGAEPYYYFNLEMFLEMHRNKAFDFLFVRDTRGNYLASMVLMSYGRYAHPHLSGRVAGIPWDAVSNFLFDEAIKLSAQHGAEIFHFGGGNSMDENDSLFRFKAHFSKQHLNFYIGTKVHNTNVYDQVIDQWRVRYCSCRETRDTRLLRYRDTCLPPRSRSICAI